MSINEYCGNLDSSILHFIFSFTDDLRGKIERKELFYKEQIARYVQKRIDLFFNSYNLKRALIQAYKYEIFNTIMFKLKNSFKENHILQCI